MAEAVTLNTKDGLRRKEHQENTRAHREISGGKVKAGCWLHVGRIGYKLRLAKCRQR